MDLMDNLEHMFELMDLWNNILLLPRDNLRYKSYLLRLQMYFGSMDIELHIVLNNHQHKCMELDSWPWQYIICWWDLHIMLKQSKWFYRYILQWYLQNIQEDIELHKSYW